MTAGQALPPLVCLDESHRKLPVGRTERYGVPDVAGVIGGVSIVACPAGASLGIFVDMDVMKVLLVISESGQCRGQLFTGKRLFMAHEA